MRYRSEPPFFSFLTFEAKPALAVALRNCRATVERVRPSICYNPPLSPLIAGDFGFLNSAVSAPALRCCRKDKPDLPCATLGVSELSVTDSRLRRKIRNPSNAVIRKCGAVVDDLSYSGAGFPLSTSR